VNFRTKQFLRKRFADYYQNSQLILPHDFPGREWGFIFFDELPEIVMRRHKAFSRENEALDYIRGMVPAHAYHSAAYYEFPGAATMKEKKWQGADLIFDLDADHLPGKVHSYKEMLDNVKSETGKLLDFLFEDFGFSENNTNIVFSGGRGYHIHVRDPKVITLESAQRREIVDYVSGTGLSIDYLFKPEKYVVVDTGRRFKKKQMESSKRIISFDKVSGGFGWGKRISQFLIHFLIDISKKDDLEASNQIVNLIRNYYLKKANIKNIGEDDVQRIIQIRNDKKIGIEKISEAIGIPEDKVRDVLIVNNSWDFHQETSAKLKNLKKFAQNPKSIEMIKKGIIDFPNITYLFDAIVDQAVHEESIHLGGGHTDEPVTSDIKRLIRMPNSLHGGSGMRVVPLSLPEFRDFEPLHDAVVFSEKMMDIETISPLKPQNSIIEMKGKSFTVSEGKNTLPEYAAMYLMCRGAAEYA
jgi:DNA primase small subunit